MEHNDTLDHKRHENDKEAKKWHTKKSQSKSSVQPSSMK